MAASPLIRAQTRPLLGVAIVLGIMLVAITAMVSGWIWIAFAAFCVVAFYPVARALATQTPIDPFEPVYVFAGTMAITFGIKGLWVMTVKSDLWGTGPILRYPDLRRWVTEAFLLSAIGLVLFYFGYYGKWGKRLGKRVPLGREITTGSRLWFAVLLAFSIGTFSIGLMFYRLGGIRAVLAAPFQIWFGAGQSWGMVGNYFLLPLVAFSSTGWALLYVGTIRRRGPLTYLALFAGFAAITAFYTVLSAKSGFLQCLLWVMVCRHYLIKRIRLRHIAGLALLTALLSPVLYTYRTYGADPRLIWQTAVATVKNPVGMGDLLLVRFPDLEGFATIIGYVRRPKDLWYGRTFEDIVFYWIPRAWWPGKPMSSFMQVNQKIFPLAYASGYPDTYSLTGELYLDFWIFGVLGFFVVGLLLRALHEHYLGGQRTLRGALLYSVAVLYIFQLASGGVTGVLFNWMCDFLPALLLVWIASSGSKIQRRLPHVDANSAYSNDVSDGRPSGPRLPVRPS